jgi:tRNA (guanine-N7-)-methyltransferase
LGERAITAHRLAPLPADCWRHLFGNAGPVAVEIGPGRGEFLAAEARHRPEWNFFAIEHSASRAAETAARLQRAGIGNARVVAGDATCLVEWMPPGSVSAFYLLFPDPWWKRRHHKRRLMTPRFVAAVASALHAGATIELVTDVDAYFADAQQVLDGEPALALETTAPRAALSTSFARKAIRRGAAIHRAVYRRTP